MTGKTDACIIGGGLVGGIMAIDLARRGFHVTVIDQESPEGMLNPKADGRTTAVNLANRLYFEELGIWSDMEPEAEMIKDIKVYEGDSPWSIHFDHQELGTDPMGYIVENRFIRQAIINKALQMPTIQWLAPAKALAKKISQTGTIVYTDVLDEKDGTLDIHASLIICADGRQSTTRDQAGISTYPFPYEQKALVFSMTHEKPHNNVAWEVFYPDGPLAFLPAKNDSEGRYRSGIVWTLSHDQADFWMTQEDTVVAAKLQALFPHLGDLALCTQKWCYPLVAQMVDRFIGQRLVIIGDAAHVCHPVAGQGVNVGWRDAKQLGEVLSRAKGVGSDLGSQSVLSTYQRSRRLDTYAIFAMTDGMVRLFSNQSSILGFLRTTGLGAVNKISPLKRFFMKRAMGM